MTIRRSIPQTLGQLTAWRMDQQQCQDWMKYSGLTEDTASRVIFQILRPAVMALSAFTGDTEDQVIAEITKANNRESEELFGLCDHAHIMHLDILKWIHNTIENVKIDPKKLAVGITRSPYYNVLDYYGRTGELALRIARDTACHVTFVDQGSLANYCYFRNRLYKLGEKLRVEQVTPAFPRPNLDNQRYGFISSLEVPIQTDQDWLDWCKIHLLPYGFIASRASLPWKKVAKLTPGGYIYQRPE